MDVFFPFRVRWMYLHIRLESLSPAGLTLATLIIPALLVPSDDFVCRCFMLSGYESYSVITSVSMGVSSYPRGAGYRCLETKSEFIVNNPISLLKQRSCFNKTTVRR